MKKILLFYVVVLFTWCAYSQSPDAFWYQAVVSGDNGSALTERNVTVRFNIRENTVTGTVIYSEIHQTTTNASGMIFLKIGKGVSSGEIAFANINWAKGDYFIEIEMDKGNG
ncbi:MAG: hypothetical protein LBE13_18190, partial [Bacteroidales bacterium]|nr:hypothetical protein [Bacteroidales bacterium]